MTFIHRLGAQGLPDISSCGCASYIRPSCAVSLPNLDAPRAGLWYASPYVICFYNMAVSRYPLLFYMGAAVMVVAFIGVLAFIIVSLA